MTEGTILFTPLLEGNQPSYLEFLGREHHALLEREDVGVELAAAGEQLAPPDLVERVRSLLP